MTKERPRATTETQQRPPGSDWITVIAVLLGIMILLVVLMELWVSHPGR